MTALDVITEVSADLNDQEPGHEFARWSKDLLRAYLREAVSQISTVLSSWFTETVIVKLTPGVGWQKACDCSKIKRILGVCDKDGTVYRYLYRMSDDDMNIWAGPIRRCPVKGDVEMISYSINASTRDTFKIYPAVPNKGTYYVLVECTKTTDGADTATISEDAEAIVKQWMLYRALSMDEENNQSIAAIAANHYKAFNDLLARAIEINRYEEEKYGTVRTVPNATSK